jgi:outer membrane lipase/esterase
VNKKMLKQLLVLNLTLLSVLFSLPVVAQQINGITVFGDSLSDNGNAAGAGAGAAVPSPPYFNGRFSNGQVWVENVISNLNLTTTSVNFAFGGATTGTANTINPALPGLTTELDRFLQASPRANPNQVYVIWAGANDYLGGGVTNPVSTVNNLSTAVQRLTGAGAQNLVVVNLPDLGRIPAGALNSAGLSQLTTAHNNLLRTSLQTFSQNNPNLSILPVDINALFNAAINNPTRFGLTNVTQPCLDITTGTVCANPNSFLFWDTIHPTAVGHRIISEYVLDTLTAAQKIAPQADIALNTARRHTYDLNGRLLTLRNTPQSIERKIGVFVNGDINFGDVRTTRDRSGFNIDHKSVTIGADYPINNNMTMGLAFSQGSSNNNLQNNQGKVSLNSSSVAVYGNYTQDKLYADAIVSYGWDSFALTRNINVTGFSQANANPSGNRFSLRVNSGYDLGNGSFSFGPTAGIRYTKVNIDSYTERDGDLLNLRVNPQQLDSFVFNIGGNLSYPFRSDFGTIAPYISANYEREFGNGDRQIVTELLTQPGIPFRSRVGSNDRDFIRLNTGIQAQFVNNLSGVLGYETIVGKDNWSDNSIHGQVRYQF